MNFIRNEKLLVLFWFIRLLFESKKLVKMNIDNVIRILFLKKAYEWVK